MTREETISLHRQMWGWIAKKIEEEREVQDIYKLKTQYMEKHGLYMLNDCFCCEYAQYQNMEENVPNDIMCRFCPLDWGNPAFESSPCETHSDDDAPVFEETDGVYGRCCKLFNNEKLFGENHWMEQAEYARQVANLKEKEDLT